MILGKLNKGIFTTINYEKNYCINIFILKLNIIQINVKYKFCNLERKILIINHKNTIYIQSNLGKSDYG